MKFAFCTLFTLLQLSSSYSLNRSQVGKYDMLIFTQVWPMTSCYEWEKKSANHTCNLPRTEEWTIHGLWPTQNGTMGPFFCNSTLHFNLKALEPLRETLEQKWIDVHKGAKPHEFWKHEWEKHGTCSVDLEVINTEAKYFKKGLDLLDKYEMSNVLAKVNIVPNQVYLLQDYLDGIKKILGKNAYVECTTNKKKKGIYVSELRICFDKQFQLIDCNGISNFPTNCNHKTKILYPGSVPNVNLVNHPHVIQI